MGTAKVGSKLEENAQLYPTRYRTPEWCSWVNIRQFENEPQWWRDNELWCKWTVPGGSVFINVIEMPFPLQDFDKVLQGVDFNGHANANCLVRIGIKGSTCYVLREEPFQYKLDDVLLQQRVLEYQTQVEGGGWNEIYAPTLKGVTKWAMTEEGKIERIKMLSQMTIVVDKGLTPKTLEHIRKASWDRNGRVDTHDLHYLAAMILAYQVGLYGLAVDGKIYKGGWR
jgi:hypothetical protein